MLARELRFTKNVRFTHVVGIGGIGAGVIFALQGNHTLGREESRLAELLDARDYCKLHIVEHYIASIMETKNGVPSPDVIAIGVVGADATGDRLLLEMKQAGIHTQWVRRDHTHPTLYSVCFAYPDGSGGNITASNSAAITLQEEDLSQATELMKAAHDRCVALCLPEVSLDIRHKFLKLATEASNFRVASFARGEIVAVRERGLFPLIDLIAVNIEEASQIVGYPYSPGDRTRFLADCSGILTAAQPNIQIVVSAGPEGAFTFDTGSWTQCPAPQLSVVSTAGAGDALLAGIICGQSLGLPLTYPSPSAQMPFGTEIRSAVELGLLLASFSVTSSHTINFDANPDSLSRFAISLAAQREPSHF